MHIYMFVDKSERAHDQEHESKARARSRPTNHAHSLLCMCAYIHQQNRQILRSSFLTRLKGSVGTPHI